MRHRKVHVILAALLLCGCATNQLRVDYAGSVADKSDAAIAGARAFLGRVEWGRRQANIDLVAADPACARDRPKLRAQPDLRRDAPKSGFLCTSDANGPGIPLLLTPIDRELEPTLLLLDALAAYSEGIARILDSNAGDPAQPLLDALALAHAAQSAALAVAGSDQGPIPAADDPRVRAAADLIGFLGELKREADQVKSLRAMITAQPAGIAPLAKSLSRELKTWERARSGDAAIRLAVTTGEAVTVLQADPPATSAARREAMTRFYLRQDTARAEAMIAPALLALVDSVAEADADMRRVLKENPDLNAAERRRVAELNRRRVLAGLNHVTALAQAFKGG